MLERSYRTRRVMRSRIDIDPKHSEPLCNRLRKTSGVHEGRAGSNRKPSLFP